MAPACSAANFYRLGARDMRFLVIRLGSIGDIVHTLPAVAALRSAWPQAEIQWLVERRMARLLEGSPVADRLLRLDRNLICRLDGEGAMSIALLFRARFDAAIDFQGLLKSALLAFLSRAPLRIGFARSCVREASAEFFYNCRVTPASALNHTIELNAALIEPLGARMRQVSFPLVALPQDESYIAERLAEHGISHFIVVNPGAGWRSKLWPPEKYGELIELVYTRLKLPSVVVAGPGEEEQVCRLAAGLRRAPLCYFPTDIKQLLVLCRRALCFVGGDTGPLHLAAAAGTPVVGIYGPTDPARYGPFGQGHSVIWRGIGCSPCHSRACPIKTNECLDIPAERVFELVERKVKGARL